MSDKAVATPICDQLRKTGNWNAAWDPIAELDPVWTEKFMAMGAHTMTSGVLEPKVLEFLAIAVDASCTHMYAPGTRRHIRKALELGAPGKRSRPSCRRSAYWVSTPAVWAPQSSWKN